MSRALDSGLVAKFTDDLPSNQPTEYEALSASKAEKVRRDAIDARKKGASRSTRRVTAVPEYIDRPGFSQGAMPPPPAPPSQPQIAVPSAWNSSVWTHPPPMPAGQGLSQIANAYGYSSAHALYGANRQIWAARAYQSSIADTITLRFKILREVNAKANGLQVLGPENSQNLSEGKPNVLAMSTPTELRRLAIETMYPKTRLALHDFPVDWSRLVLREIANWVDIGQESPNTPYFYSRCLTGKPKSKDGVPTFKKPTKPFELALVIDADYWGEIEEYEAQRELDTEMGSRTSHGSKVDSLSDHRRSRPQSPPPSASSFEFKLGSASFDSIRNEPAIGPRVSQSIPRTPPQNKKRELPAYESPNRNQLRDALLESGTSYSLVSGQVPHRPLKDLLSGPSFQGFTCSLASAAQGSLGMEHNQYLGIGTFKTAHAGYLSLVHLNTDGLGTKPNEAVAVKRMYVRSPRPTESKPNGWVINRLMPMDEFRKTIMEANVLQWASSIMTFTYSFIYHFLENSPTPPPFEIPDIRFVHAGVAVIYEQQATGPAANPQSKICRTYLIEELIDASVGRRDSFHKFINNGSAVPVPTDDEALAAIAEFLSFTQHVQFYKTAGMVYISDLQGTPNLLTDPQIMTSPSIGDGAEIFGDGNVPAAFSAFSEQHLCNQFCYWFELPSLGAEPAAE
ncbi:hypothetical protein B0H15DRAFT_805289 [Mycena belliarum]|uniref:Alpha-type protein kinase domain-containing protein n=1 Tax=Mycena belliarum TaxID=1033014 RepID=A0AAD6TV14_9AGAR|nr:hypothetical protein B0H15DRAFT_805289 [Mycena belliae]